ncbi:MAG: enoyl-CoA hydratase-related protein [Myxococcaceae bacterium]
MALINLTYTGTNQEIAELTLNRPEVLNALNMAMLDELTSSLAPLQQLERGIQVLIIRGAGERAFSAGADLKERAGMTLDQTRDFLVKINHVFDLIANLPIPTIAHINGFAFGGGLELALACDMRVMAPHAQTGLTECALGIIPGAGGTSRLPSIIGYAKACELIFSAKRIGAEEALKIGLVNQTEDSALELASKIALCSLTSLKAAKEAMKTGEVARCYEQVLNSPERLEALKVFTS